MPVDGKTRSATRVASFVGVVGSMLNGLRFKMAYSADATSVVLGALMSATNSDLRRRARKRTLRGRLRAFRAIDQAFSALITEFEKATGRPRSPGGLRSGESTACIRRRRALPTKGAAARPGSIRIFRPATERDASSDWSHRGWARGVDED
jgi:hypothetical protein